MSSSPRLILGVDPGLSGALAFLDPVEQTLEIFDMPLIVKKKAGKKRSDVNMYELARIMDHYADRVKKAYVEYVASSPQMGVVSATSFARATRSAEQAIASCFIPQERVTPKVWKQDMKLNRDKNVSRAMASKLFPAFGNLWNLVKHDGRAEAALIALWGSRQLER